MPYIIKIYKSDNGNIKKIDEEKFDNVAFAPEMTSIIISRINQSITGDIPETTVIISGKPSELCQVFKNNLVDGLELFYCHEGIDNFLVDFCWLERKCQDELHKGKDIQHQIKIIISNRIQDIGEFLFYIYNMSGKTDFTRELIEQAIKEKFTLLLKAIVDNVYDSFEYPVKFMMLVSPFEMDSLKKYVVSIPFPNLYLVELSWREFSCLDHEISQLYQEEFCPFFDKFDSIMNAQIMNDMIKKIQNYDYESENQKKKVLIETQMEILTMLQRKYKEIKEKPEKENDDG